MDFIYTVVNSGTSYPSLIKLFETNVQQIGAYDRTTLVFLIYFISIFMYQSICIYLSNL